MMMGTVGTGNKEQGGWRLWDPAGDARLTYLSRAAGCAVHATRCYAAELPQQERTIIN